MLDMAIYGMVFLGAALMVYNVYNYIQYSRHLQEQSDLETERNILYLPLILLVCFLIGYLVVGIFGKPDLVMAGILFGGSIFVYVIFLFMRRITDKIKANEQLAIELRSAEESNRAKASFLANMSHEMRTPMNAIIGLDTIALRNPDLSDQTRDQLEKIGTSAQYLQSLIDDMLDMGRIESQQQRQMPQVPFSLSDLVEQLNVVTKVRCVEKGLEYRSFAVGALSPSYLGDPSQLRRVLSSMLDNAVKFTPAPGTVSFVTEHYSSEGGKHQLRFMIIDTGIGIDKDFLPKLFEPFAMEDASATNTYGGAGLDLAVAKGIIDLMGGSISVKSEKDVGSTFIVSVDLDPCEAPAKDVDNADDATAEDTTSAAAPTAAVDATGADDAGTGGADIIDAIDAAGHVATLAPALGATEGSTSIAGKHVLIVDDIDINAEILADLLDLEEVTSEHAENGQVAVDLFAASEPGHFDAIFMDLRMPVMDGYEATRAIRALDRADAKTIPILALTANAFEEDREHALEAGMDVHLAKPVDADLLYETLGQLVSQEKG